MLFPEPIVYFERAITKDRILNFCSANKTTVQQLVLLSKKKAELEGAVVACSCWSATCWKSTEGKVLVDVSKLYTVAKTFSCSSSVFYE